MAVRLRARQVQALGRRAKAVEEELSTKLKARMSRVWKLATTERPGPGPARGLFVFMPDFDRAFVSRDALCGGQRRMADDPQAPSRSYLKAEEAYAVLGREPAAGETVVDLGAAPGGRSYSAAKRGARVVAVDNGPLKAGAIHALVEHREEDAFKLGRADALKALDRAAKALKPHRSLYRARHLYHDREEITFVGERA